MCDGKTQQLLDFGNNGIGCAHDQFSYRHAVSEKSDGAGKQCIPAQYTVIFIKNQNRDGYPQQGKEKKVAKENECCIKTPKLLFWQWCKIAIQGGRFSFLSVSAFGCGNAANPQDVVQHACKNADKKPIKGAKEHGVIKNLHRRHNPFFFGVASR